MAQHKPAPATSSDGAAEAWRQGFEHGVTAGVAGILKRLEEKLGPVEAARVVRALAPPDTSSGWAALLAIPAGRPSTGETPGQKSARLRRTQRLIRDEQQAVELAALIRGGDTTESARRKMGVGVVRAQRIRSVAVRLGLLQRRAAK